jgi:hypothetical protein
MANTVPLCMRHHREQHRIGIRSFEARYAVNLETAAIHFGARSLARLYRPDLHPGSAHPKGHSSRHGGER